MGCDQTYDDAHMKKLRKIKWCRDRNYIVSHYLPMGRAIWNCNICFSLVDDQYVVEQGRVKYPFEAKQQATKALWLELIKGHRSAK